MITFFIICAMIASSKSRTKKEILLEDIEQLKALHRG